MNNYLIKLKDPRWQKKRLEVFNRDGFKCILCNSENFELHVHHIRYKGEPWESPIEDLETLCCHCHAMKTKFKATGAVRLKSSIIYKCESSVIVYGIPEREPILGFPYESEAPGIIFDFIKNGK